ncbi:hypothetical protein H4683_001754 [Filibacter limicola]|uniref:Uncharacterized protein n=1 Tax=Sporosarcina limicola TaxID=34101 RepID=A0A927MIW8_9BACL|nr:hypothetical protein [Sporosarcina limicola]
MLRVTNQYVELQDQEVVIVGQEAIERHTV